MTKLPLYSCIINYGILSLFTVHGHVPSMRTVFRLAMQPLAKYASENLTDRPRSPPPTHAFQLTAPAPRPPLRRPHRRHRAWPGLRRRLPLARERGIRAAWRAPGRFGRKVEMVFVWLTAFFLVVALIVLVIYQVSAAPRIRIRALAHVGSCYGRSPAKLRLPLSMSFQSDFQWFRGRTE